MTSYMTSIVIYTVNSDEDEGETETETENKTESFRVLGRDIDRNIYNDNNNNITETNNSDGYASDSHHQLV